MRDETERAHNSNEAIPMNYGELRIKYWIAFWARFFLSQLVVRLGFVTFAK
jgi:hypothetical protein